MKKNKSGIIFTSALIIIGVIFIAIIAIIGVFYVKAIFDGITVSILRIVSNPIVILFFVIILFIWLLQLTGLLDKIIKEYKKK